MEQSLKDFPGQALPYWVSQPFNEFIDDMEDLWKVINLAVNGIARETAMPQAHCFLATELALKAQANANKLKPGEHPM